MSINQRYWQKQRIHPHGDTLLYWGVAVRKFQNVPDKQGPPHIHTSLTTGIHGSSRTLWHMVCTTWQDSEHRILAVHNIRQLDNRYGLSNQMPENDKPLTPTTRVCAIYRTLLGCYENPFRSDLFITLVVGMLKRQEKMHLKMWSA